MDAWAQNMTRSNTKIFNIENIEHIDLIESTLKHIESIEDVEQPESGVLAKRRQMILKSSGTVQPPRASSRLGHHVRSSRRHPEAASGVASSSLERVGC